MKKLLIGTFILVGLSFSGISVFGTTYSCSVSSDESQNDGFCRALSSGNGDMCFTYGQGPACSGTIEGGGVGG